MGRITLRGLIVAAVSAAGLLCASCSTPRGLAEGEYILKKNSIEIESVGKGVTASDLMSYVRQQPPSFSFAWTKPVVFNEELVGKSEENIQEHLRYLGFYNSSVDSRVDYKNGKAHVTYHVLPGDRYPVSEVSFVLPERGTFAEDFCKDTANVSIKPGDFLSEAACVDESERSAAYMRTQGYYGFNRNYYFFEADTLSGPDSVKLVIQVKEHTRSANEAQSQPLIKSRVHEVTLSHPERIPFREKVLTNLNTIKPGALYDETDINTTYQRLSALKVFNSVNVELTPVDTGLVNCDISLGASRVQGMNLGLEASTNSSGLIGVSPQLSYYHKNFFHGGEWFNLSFLGNFQFKFNDKTRSDEFGVSAGLSLPRFLGIPNSFFKEGAIPRTEIKLAYSYQDRPEYTRSIISTSYGYSGTAKKRFTYQVFPIQVNVVRLFNLDPDFFSNLNRNPFMRYSYQNHFDAGMGGMMYYSTSPELNPQDTYTYTRLSFDLSGNLISLFNRFIPHDEAGVGLVWGAPYSQFVRAEWTVGHTWRFGRNNGQAIATRFLCGGGYAYGNSSAMPFEKQFYAGGANSMRGWQVRSLGPGRAEINPAFSIPSQTGDFKLEANVEYRADLFWKLEGAVFVDVGNVWLLKESSLYLNPDKAPVFESLAADWGLGLRCDLNFLVIRIDTGFKVYEPAFDLWRGPGMWLKRDGFAVHFGVGYPF